MINEKSIKLYNLKFFLTIMIVLLHSFVPIDGETMDVKIINTIYLFGVCAVPSFFFISGYLFFINYDIHNWKQKISKRFKTLLIPYVLWNCIMCVLWFVVYNTFGQEYLVAENIPTDFFHAVMCVFQYSPLWYIFNLFIYVLLGRILYGFIQKRNLGFFILCFSLVAITCIHLSYFSLMYWLPFFLLGGFVSIHFKDYIYTEKNHVLIATIFVWIALFILDKIFTHYVITTLLRMTSPFFAFALYGYIDKYKHIREHHIYKYSFFLYSLHYVPLSVGQRWCLLHYGEYHLGVLATALAIPILVITLCIMIAYVIDRKWNRLYSVLIGNRR